MWVRMESCEVVRPRLPQRGSIRGALAQESDLFTCVWWVDVRQDCGGEEWVPWEV